MDFFYDQGISIVQIKCGFAHNLALDAAGRACYFCLHISEHADGEH